MPSDESPQQAGPQQAGASRRHRIELNSVQVIASVAAAVSAAIAASALGIAGTIAGTAVVSVVATVGNALYSATLKRGKDTLVQAQQLILARPVEESAGPAEPETVAVAAATVRLRDAVPAASGDTDPTSLAAHRSEPAVPPAAEPTTPPRATRTGTGTVYGRRRRSRLTPKRVGILAGSAALVFVLAFGVLTGIESAMGTSFPALFGHGDSGSTAGALLRGDNGSGGNGGTDTGDSGTAGSPSHSPSTSPTGTPSPRSSATSPSHGGGSTASPSASPRTSSPTPAPSATTTPTG